MSFTCQSSSSTLYRDLDTSFSTCGSEPMINCMTVQSGKKVIRGDRKGPDGRDHGRKSISEDLVSVINDGLYFYEQVKL
jgi:hypothetical protein